MKLSKLCKVGMSFLTKPYYRTRVLIKLGYYDSLSDEDFLKKVFPNGDAFLKSSFSNAALLFSFFRLVTFPVIVVSYYKIFSNLIDWLGMDAINPGNINPREPGNQKHVLWCFFLTVPLILIFIALALMFTIFPLQFNIPSMISAGAWLEHFGLYFIYPIFMIFGIKMIYGWRKYAKSHY